MIQIGSKKEKVVNKVVLIQIDEIATNPAQPRTSFQDEQLKVLAQSIKENGLLQPLTIRKNYKGGYELISGERRLRACRLLDYQQVPCIVVEKTDSESAVLALIENIHREDLNIFEQATALRKLISEWNVTQDEAAVKLGMAQSTVANKIRILKLTQQEQDLIIQNQLTERHARALLKLEKIDQRIELIQMIKSRNLTVLQTENYIQNLNQVKHKKRKIPIIKDVRLFINTVNKAIQVMKDAGVPATAKKVEEDTYIEYTVRIPTKI